MKKQYENIFCIVNEGFQDAVMEAAWEEGATGGTILSARGTGSKNAEKDFGIVIHDEKVIVLIIVPSAIKENVMHAIYKKCGLNTPGQGIAFSMPVSDVVGINS